MATFAVVLIAGTAQAQVILEDDELRIEFAGIQTARLTQGGDLYLGGDGMFGDILSFKATDGLVLLFSATSADLTLGGATSGTPQDGDVFLKDSDGITNTIWLDGGIGAITLGASGSNEDGDILVRDNDGSTSIQMDGSSGNVTNQFAGNGLIKAWARINSTGTVASCWRCSANPLNTSKLATGIYEVDFTIASDITARPRAAILDTHSTSTTVGEISLANRAGDASTVWVGTHNSAGAFSDRSFTIVIY